MAAPHPHDDAKQPAAWALHSDGAVQRQGPIPNDRHFDPRPAIVQSLWLPQGPPQAGDAHINRAGLAGDHQTACGLEELGTAEGCAPRPAERVQQGAFPPAEAMEIGRAHV